jgi:hypothetical protein
MRGRFWLREVGRAFVGTFAASLTLTKEQSLIFGDVQLNELLFQNQCATVLRCIDIGGSRSHILIVDVDHKLLYKFEGKGTARKDNAVIEATMFEIGRAIEPERCTLRSFRAYIR